jgi:CHASE2 domain-containing sensor protein
VVRQVAQVGANRVVPGADDVLHDLALAVRLGLALLDPDGAHRAFADAGPQPIAEQVADQARLAIDQLQGALGTVGNAIPAAVAQLRVDVNDPAFHGFSHLRQYI